MADALEDINPIALFAEWYGEAANCGLKEPTAVTLATADGRGRPTARMVLLKGHDARGFVFYTNTESRKGDALSQNPFAALCFYWPPLGRQVRIEGAVEPVAHEEADAYFASRDRQVRIGAWASAQSRPLEGQFALEKAVARFAAKYAIGEVPRPPHWSGYRISPDRIEFWSQGVFRLHDRRVFTREGDGWTTMRLFP